MIRASATRQDGTPMMIIGLTERNFIRLKSGKSIRVSGESFGVNVELVIVYGTTDQDIIDDFKRAGVVIPLPDEEDDGD
jgi:hypothetical protein